MALTKAMTVVHDWNEVAQNTAETSTIADVSDSYESALKIQAGLYDTTAHTGTEFIVMVNANSSDDEDWAELTKFPGLIGTAVTEPISNNPLAAGSGSCTAADTAGYETYGTGIDEVPGWLLIKNSTLINSELVYQITYVTDTSITWSGVTKNEHVQNTPLWNIAISKVIHIPFWVSRVKVIVNNHYDINGSILAYRVLAGEVTALT